MGNRRIRVLIGITFSSLLICQMGVIPAYGAESPLLVEVGEEKFVDSIWDENGFRISSGILTSFDAGSVVLEENKYNIKIPNYVVVGIGEGAFSGELDYNAERRNITTVSIPRSVNEIGKRCFKECTGLTTVTFNKNLPYDASDYHDLTLGSYVFAGCTSLKTIDLADKDRIKSVGSNLFEGCTSLQSVTLSNGMTDIPANMFKDCTSLKHLEIPDNITTIDPTAFDGTSDIKLYCKSDSNAAKAIKEYQEKSGKTISVSYTDLSSYEKEKQEITLNLKEDILIEDKRIFCYHDDPAFYLNPSTSGIGMKFEFKFKSENEGIVLVDENGLVTICGIGSTYIYIDVLENEYYKSGFLKVPITITERGKDPVIPPDDPTNPDDPNNPDNPDDPNKPTDPNDPDDPNKPTDPDDPNSNPGDGNSNGGGGNENTDPVKKKEQEIKVKRIELTYGDASFTIQPGKDMGKKVTFSSSNKKVFTVNSKGKITIKGCGLANLKIKSKTATKTYEIVVKPKKNNIATLETKKRKIIVKWKRDKKADGYYVYYTTDSKFKKNVKKIQVPKNKTLQCTLKKLKSGKKYYVRLYSYKKSGKNIILSDASKIRNIKVK